MFGVSVKKTGGDGGPYGQGILVLESAGRFVTSSYYYDAYPEWVKAWNSRACLRIQRRILGTSESGRGLPLRGS